MIDFSPLTCPEVLDLLGPHLAGELVPATDARVIEHIRGCADCRERVVAVELKLRLMAQADGRGR